jgi:hypothetical protein
MARYEHLPIYKQLLCILKMEAVCVPSAVTTALQLK